ncbi:MAG TPA: PAS domain S-box protein [Acidimicrobiales bacterium]|nr:PAS domain S-box protein [Acidimicrobiales bacterium]
MDAFGPSHRQPLVSDFPPGALLRAVVEMSDDAIFTCDMAGQVTAWSATAERLFGSPAGDVLGTSFSALFAPHLRHEVETAIAIVVAGDLIKHFETEVVRPDGMPTPLSLSMCPLVDAGGVPVGSLVIARDITEQRLAQATLAEVEARLEEGEALAHVGSWLWDVRTGAVQLSAEFYRVHGVEPLEFDGTFESYLGLVEAEDRERVRAAMSQSVATGHPFEETYRVVRPDGHTRVVQARAQPTLGSAGTAMGLRGIGQDVTDRGGGYVSRRPKGT